MGRQPIALLAGMLAAAVIVAGCGSSSASDGDGAEEVTASSIAKADFIKKADEICEKREKQTQVDFGVFSTEKKQEELKEPTEDTYDELIAVVVAPNLEQEVNEIRALGAPQGDEDKVEAFVDAVEEGQANAEDSPKLILTNSHKLFEKASALAKAYGLEACSTR